MSEPFNFLAMLGPIADNPQEALIDRNLVAERCNGRVAEVG